MSTRGSVRSYALLSVVMLLPAFVFVFASAVANADVQGGSADDSSIGGLALVPVSDAVRVPWGISVLPDGDLLVTERDGQLFRIKPSGAARQVSGVASVWAKGQGGLLDVAVHPDFDREPWVYFSYAKPLPSGSHTAVARAKLRGNRLSDWEDLYVGTAPTTKKHHFGSRVVLHDGYVFFSIGDRGNRDANPQDLSRDGGKVYRLQDDGRVPSDNPFVETESAIPAIWSLGHRNPQGLAWDKKSGQLWLHEHGPKGGDELNLIKPSKNYGWPRTTFGINYGGTRITNDALLEGIEAPVWHWTPSIAPSGLAVVDADRYPSLGDGLMVGSLKFGELHFWSFAAEDRVPMRVVLNGLNRVRSLAAGPDGTLYVGITGEGVFRLEER